MSPSYKNPMYGNRLIANSCGAMDEADGAHAWSNGNNLVTLPLEHCLPSFRVLSSDLDNDLVEVHVTEEPAFFLPPKGQLEANPRRVPNKAKCFIYINELYLHWVRTLGAVHEGFVWSVIRTTRDPSNLSLTSTLQIFF